jgi:hypothetical protein
VRSSPPTLSDSVLKSRRTRFSVRTGHQNTSFATMIERRGIQGPGLSKRAHWSFDFVQRIAPSANPCEIRHLLQSGTNSRFAWEGRTLGASDRAVRRHRATDAWRSTPSICMNLSFRKGQVPNVNVHAILSRIAGASLMCSRGQKPVLYPKRAR